MARDISSRRVSLGCEPQKPCVAQSATPLVTAHAEPSYNAGVILFNADGGHRNPTSVISCSWILSWTRLSLG